MANANVFEPRAKNRESLPPKHPTGGPCILSSSNVMSASRAEGNQAACRTASIDRAAPLLEVVAARQTTLAIHSCFLSLKTVREPAPSLEFPISQNGRQACSTERWLSRRR